MKENDIRPDALMVESDKLHAEDVQRLFLLKEQFIEIPCPACESKKYEVKFEKCNFTFVTCVKCGTMYINPRPTFKMLKDFYMTANSIRYWNDRIFPVSEYERRKRIAAPRAERVIELSRRLKIKNELLVDVGAGFGTFCEEVKKFKVFKRIIALGPSPVLGETCRKKGLEVVMKPIEEAQLNNVSVVTSFELIEHLYWPKDFILSCKNMLDDNGILILTTPNIYGFDLSLLGKVSDNILGPNHLNYFHPESLTLLMKRCGLKVIAIETPGKLDAEIVRNKILKGIFDISNNVFLKNVLIDHWGDTGEDFQKFLAEHK